jgi:hypothetical protein
MTNTGSQMIHIAQHTPLVLRWRKQFEILSSVWNPACTKTLTYQHTSRLVLFENLITIQLVSIHNWKARFGHKSFKCNFCTNSQKTANENTISNKYSILIGRFWHKSMKLVFECFMSVRPEIDNNIVGW